MYRGKGFLLKSFVIYVVTRKLAQRIARLVAFSLFGLSRNAARIL